MAEKYIYLSGFKYGLDARKSVLTSVPGTLVKAENCFVNIGGELEQRMSFVRDANTYPSNTFGLQDTDSGLVTFGSDAAPSGPLPVRLEGM